MDQGAYKLGSLRLLPQELSAGRSGHGQVMFLAQTKKGPWAAASQLLILRALWEQPCSGHIFAEGEVCSFDLQQRQALLKTLQAAVRRRGLNAEGQGRAFLALLATHRAARVYAALALLRQGPEVCLHQADLRWRDVRERLAQARAGTVGRAQVRFNVRERLVFAQLRQTHPLWRYGRGPAVVIYGCRHDFKRYLPPRGPASDFDPRVLWSNASGLSMEAVLGLQNDSLLALQHAPLCPRPADPPMQDPLPLLWREPCLRDLLSRLGAPDPAGL